MYALFHLYWVYTVQRSTAIYAPCTLPYFQKLRRCRLNHSLAACLFVCLLPSPSLTFQCTMHKAHITLLQSVIQILAPACLLFCKSPVSMWYSFSNQTFLVVDMAVEWYEEPACGQFMKYIQSQWHNINVAQSMRSLFNVSPLNRRLWWQGRRSCANQKTHSDAESRGWTEQRSVYRSMGPWFHKYIKYMDCVLCSKKKIQWSVSCDSLTT